MNYKVRSKVASKISKIKEADDFNFSNWLKKPLQQNHPIEQITSYVKDLDDLQIEFISPDQAKYKFDMVEPEVTDELKNCDFPKIRSNAIFFMIALPMEEGVVYSDVELKHKSFSDKKIEFVLRNPEIKKLKASIDAAQFQEYDFKIEIPTNNNFLSNLVPEIFKIDLLDFEDLVSSAKKVKVQSVSLDKFKKTKIEKVSLPGLPEPKKIFKIKVPSMGVYKFSEKKIPISIFELPTISDTNTFQIPKVKTWYAQFTLPETKSLLFYRTSKSRGTSSKSEKPEDKIVDPQLSEQLSVLLSNLRKVDWEKSGRHLTKLSPHEEVSTKFLVENNYAMLQDEFGIDIQKETIAAIKLLFINRVVKSALIITDKTMIGNAQSSKNLSMEIGWADKLKKYSPELAFNIISGNNDERADLWNKWKPIVIADIDTAFDDYRLRILEDKYLEKFDCVILDSVDQILENQEGKAEFLSTIQPRILWASTNVLDRSLPQELNTLLNNSVNIEKVQARSKQLMAESLPKFIFNEFWCDADENQAAEFKTAIVECRKDLRRVLESGNPLRFYANIFTLFHKLNQIGNFASDKSRSPKANLLLNHLSIIKKNGKKVLLLSQYEKLGLKKISEILTNNGIKHVLAPNSLSADEMQRTISTFQSQSDIVAIVSDAKVTRLKFSNFDVPYIIKFDQWWNPISNWEMEDIFVKEEDGLQNESINLCNYYVAGTLDQKIRELLVETDLLNKNLFELMQPKMYEELILVDEWLKVFGMPVNDEVKTGPTPETVQINLQKITIDAFRKILTRLLTVLGFSNVDILELPSSNSFNAIGKSQRNGKEFFLNAFVFEERKIEKKDIEKVLSESSTSSHNKIFIITRESFPEIPSGKLRNNVTILDGLALSKLLIRAGILPT